MDQGLVEELKQCKPVSDDYNVASGKTMCANDFYEGNYGINSTSKYQK